MQQLIKHIVMWKLKDFAEGQTKSENLSIIKTRLEALKDKIEQIRFLEVGINLNQSEQAYDAVLCSEFSSLEDLNIYKNHPEHVKISQFVSKVREARVVVDYEI
jgi:hypothetical protein